ncbi:hypothetical protein SAMN05877838_3461 [Hoeflea halophila]|uniref:Uncharacterized protein n=1 Tax=Hoeflea halophila TaxID=714899 RepID=A0A286IEG2_9HYPH|nr:hypothetical protein SAMN05877838_3461 [Hoeflea halophila]
MASSRTLRDFPQTGELVGWRASKGVGAPVRNWSVQLREYMHSARPPAIRRGAVFCASSGGDQSQKSLPANNKMGIVLFNRVNARAF